MIFANLADAVWEAVSTEPFSFFIGGIAGWLIAQRFRLVRVRKPKKEDE